MTTTKQVLDRLYACADALDHPHPQDPAQAWATCERGDWLLWLAARAGVDHRLLVRTADAAADAADAAADAWVGAAAAARVREDIAWSDVAAGLRRKGVLR